MPALPALPALLAQWAVCRLAVHRWASIVAVSLASRVFTFPLYVWMQQTMSSLQVRLLEARPACYCVTGYRAVHYFQHATVRCD